MLYLKFKNMHIFFLSTADFSDGPNDVCLLVTMALE